jgi:hypothetical protein
MVVLKPQLQSGTGFVDRFVSILEEDDILHKPEGDLLLLLLFMFNLNLGKEFENQ